MGGEIHFTRQELVELFEPLLGRTLGEVDKAGVLGNPGFNKGVAGHVVEKSILGYPANSDQRPDIVVDGVQTEVKTTGLRRKGGGYAAKEPMSVTAVSPESIVAEEFEDSHFWAKAEHMFLVYYLYLVGKADAAMQYADFPLVDYHFHEFDDDEVAALRHDWLLVRDYVRRAYENHPDPAGRREAIAGLGQALRGRLMMVDTVPRSRPRFRFSQRTVNAIVQKKLGSTTLEKLPGAYTCPEDVDRVLHRAAGMYRGMTLGEIAGALGVSPGAKQLLEQVFVRMFDGKAKKMNRIELFERIGLKLKSIPLRPTGAKKEDVKMLAIDFAGLTRPAADADGPYPATIADDARFLERHCPDLLADAGKARVLVPFEDSDFCSHFVEGSFVFAVSRQRKAGDKLADQVFLGFKRMEFDDDFVYGEVRRTYYEIADLVVNGKLELVPELDAKGNQVCAKSGVPIDAPNFPKAADHVVFVRGTGADATRKPETVNGLRMYRQHLWVRGRYIVEKLASRPWV